MDLNGTPTHFIFPVLKNAEILQCMAELEIDLSKSELTQPERHKDKVKIVFLELLDLCCGLVEEDLETSNDDKIYDKLELLQYSELHEDYFSDLKFFFAIRKLLNTCGIYDFSWKDLHTPTAKRLRWQLSAIVNMAKFREEQLKVYSELNEPRAELLETLDQVSKENVELSTQLEKVEVESEMKINEIDEVVQQCEELETEIAQNNKLQAAKREEAALLKKQSNDLKDQVQAAEWTLQEVEAEEQKLLSQVVSSPDRKKNVLIEKRSILANEKHECDVMDRKYQQTKNLCVDVEVATKELKSAISVVIDLQNESNKYLLLQNQLKDVQNNIGEDKKRTDQLHEHIAEDERELNCIEEKISNLKQEGDVQMSAAQDSLEKAKNELLHLEKDRRDGMARVQAGEAEVRNLEAVIMEQQRQTRQEIQNLIKEYRLTEKVVATKIDEWMHTIGPV